MATIVLISVASRKVNDLFDCQENGTQVGLIISDLILPNEKLKNWYQLQYYITASNSFTTSH